ncbi:MAG: transketolase [Coriobacteriia bacterium]|nr:transketolase [Coriobacteriia bacterium]MCL2537109.1 transketolase [Coriobacteriia bacterium]
MPLTQNFSVPTDFDLCLVREQANKMRVDIVKMLTAAGSGHPGGSLSAADIVSVLYFGGVMSYDPADLKAPWRDRFILSKGHAAPVQYAALALAGIIDEEELLTIRQLGSRLQGHPDASKCPGIEVSTGSLGQGLSIACGLAQALKLSGQMGADGRTPPKIYLLMGDGELQEGQNWEAALYAAHYGLDNVVAIVDRNYLQIDGDTEEVMALGDVAAKFGAFGWDVATLDGHDEQEIYDVLTRPRYSSKPLMIDAVTTKGKGVSFMEDVAGWHGVAPSQEQCDTACQELAAEMRSFADALDVELDADSETDGLAELATGGDVRG